MSVVYNTNVINSRLTDVATAIDAGGSNGVLRIFDGLTQLWAITLARPSATVAGGVLTFNGLTLAGPAAAANGTATSATVTDSAGTVVISGLTVGTSSASNIVLAPTNAVLLGQTIALTAAQITGH